ncbi:MAG: alkaline shock response membrane anchor protein AmaP [Syntrophomonadaceae bacterium]|jgi:uncharacterized alkaline shock family protein YloU|nr:alkaline shock response membrane anchor protein AmaP [Syntrophomonadaceae bacterium]
MSGLLRAILFLYNVILLAVGAILAAAALGQLPAMNYLEVLFSTVQNRLILGSAGIIIIVLALVVFVALFKRAPREDAIVIENALSGQISMTVAAAKVIIHKAVQKVEGVKETRTSIENQAEGLIIYIHMMINPDLSVPDLSKQIQEVIKEDMLNIGGLNVEAVKVLIDDLNVSGKAATAIAK